MIKAVIIEDEKSGRENLINLLGLYCENVEVVGVGTSVAEGVKILKDPATQPDVAFLDINLSDGLVFQLLKQIPDINFDIIFVTAFEKFAIKACQFAAIGYIMKPIDPDELESAVKRIKPRANSNAKATANPQKIQQRLEVFEEHYTTAKHKNPNSYKKISISALDGIHFKTIQDIVRLEAEDNYTHIFFKDGKRITSSKTIKVYQKLLEPANFYRVHKSHMINLNYMSKFVKGDGGYVVLEDGKNIEVSRRKKAAFLQKLKALQEFFV